MTRIVRFQKTNVYGSTLTITGNVHNYFISVNIVLLLICRYDIRNLPDCQNYLRIFYGKTINKKMYKTIRLWNMKYTFISEIFKNT